MLYRWSDLTLGNDGIGGFIGVAMISIYLKALTPWDI